MEKKFTIKERIIQLAKYKGFTLEDFVKHVVPKSIFEAFQKYSFFFYREFSTT